jgi:hypothetical protein
VSTAGTSGSALAPHVRLGGLRLKQLADEIRGTLARQPEAAARSAPADLAEIGALLATRHAAAIEALVPAVNEMSAALLERQPVASVAQVDGALRSLTAAVAELIAVREQVRRGVFPASLAAARRQAEEIADEPLRELAGLFEQIHLAVLDPAAFLARHPSGEVRVALPLERGQEFRDLYAWMAATLNAAR